VQHQLESILSSAFSAVLLFLGSRCWYATCYPFTTLCPFVLLLACLCSFFFTLLLLPWLQLFVPTPPSYVAIPLPSVFSSLSSFLFCFSSCANRFSSFSSNALMHSVLVRTLAGPVLVCLSCGILGVLSSSAKGEHLDSASWTWSGREVWCWMRQWTQWSRGCNNRGGSEVLAHDMACWLKG